MGNWKPLKAGKNGPEVSHLMFADDLLLFGQATTSQMHCMRETLKKFCDMSGQQVSIEKTSMFFSKGVPGHHRKYLVELSGFKEVFSLG